MTNFKLIYDRAISRIRDYRLDNLFNRDEDVFYNYMRVKLYEAIDVFNGCLTSLEYTSETTDGVVEWYFIEDLSSKEISILSYGIVISWMEQNLLDITQMNMHLSTREFKSFSTSVNLKEKSNVLDKMKEDMDREITEYQLKNISAISFFGGV